MKVALYARVSSERQDVDLSISAQLKALRGYALKEGYQVVREYVDEAESGRSRERPVFQEMVRAARVKPPPFQAIEMGEMERRLGRLYDALETGKVELDDLAPRIKELKEKRGLLERARAEAQEAVAAGRVEMVSREVGLTVRKPERSLLLSLSSS